MLRSAFCYLVLVLVVQASFVHGSCDPAEACCNSDGTVSQAGRQCSEPALPTLRGDVCDGVSTSCPSTCPTEIVNSCEANSPSLQTCSLNTPQCTGIDPCTIYCRSTEGVYDGQCAPASAFEEMPSSYHADGTCCTVPGTWEAGTCQSGVCQVVATPGEAVDEVPIVTLFTRTGDCGPSSDSVTFRWEVDPSGTLAHCLLAATTILTFSESRVPDYFELERIERNGCYSSGFVTVDENIPGEQREYTINGLEAANTGITFHLFRIRGRNAAGVGDYSQEYLFYTVS